MNNNYLIKQIHREQIPTIRACNGFNLGLDLLYCFGPKRSNTTTNKEDKSKADGSDAKAMQYDIFISNNTCIMRIQVIKNE